MSRYIHSAQHAVHSHATSGPRRLITIKNTQYLYDLGLLRTCGAVDLYEMVSIDNSHSVELGPTFRWDCREHGLKIDPRSRQLLGLRIPSGRGLVRNLSGDRRPFEGPRAQSGSFQS